MMINGGSAFLHLHLLLLSLVYLICLAGPIHSCSFDETTLGCRLATADEMAGEEEDDDYYEQEDYYGSKKNHVDCLCGIGCKREFPFRSRTDCLAHLDRAGKSPLLPLSPPSSPTSPPSTLTTTSTSTTTTTKTTTTASTTTAEPDPCLPDPCLNGGQCIHMRFSRFRCECAGTDHFGDLCQNDCPEQMGVNAFGYQDPDYPLDCIKI